MLDWRFNNKLNVIKFSEKETFDHFLAKCLLCWELKQNKKDFYTEAIFDQNKGRADIFVPILKEAWEVKNTEKDQSIKTKEAKYPCKVMSFKAKKIIDFWIKNRKL